MTRTFILFILASFTANIQAEELKCHRLPNDWTITRGLDIASIEKKELDEIDMLKDDEIPRVPFGFINHKWEELKSILTQTRELVEFNSPSETWEALAGRKGYAVLENGCVIAVMITEMS